MGRRRCAAGRRRERVKFTAYIRGLGGERGRPRVLSNVFGDEHGFPASDDLFDNFLGGGGGDRYFEGDHGPGELV
jgi:hypothetical protein